MPILDFPVLDIVTLPPEEADDMVTQEERIKGLETQVGNIRQTLGTIQGQLNAPAPLEKTTHPFLTVMISALCLAVLWYWGWIGTQVVEHGRRLTEISVLLSPQKLIQTAASPTTNGSINSAKQILATAKQKGVQISPTVIKEVGDKFMEASKETPQAWPLVLQLAEYRTGLNADAAPSPPDVQEVKGASPPWYIYVEGMAQPGTRGTHTYLISLETVPNVLAAHYERIGSALNQGKPRGPSLIIIEGNNQNIFHLDGEWLQNVVIRNSAIVYDGGPLILNNVYFVNCTFNIKQQPHGQAFAKGVLDTPSVTLDLSATHS